MGCFKAVAGDSIPCSYPQFEERTVYFTNAEKSLPFGFGCQTLWRTWPISRVPHLVALCLGGPDNYQGENSEQDRHHPKAAAKPEKIKKGTKGTKCELCYDSLPGELDGASRHSALPDLKSQ